MTQYLISSSRYSLYRSSFFLILMLLIGLCKPYLAHAHAEKDKARFVAENGLDQGNCDNPLRPCKTIGYAVNHANKGDKVLVAKGSYEADILLLSNQLTPILGGYDRFDHFQFQNPDANPTYITGAPVTLSDTLTRQGFIPIRDSKSQPSPQLLQQLSQLQQLQQVQSNQDCVNGRAGQFSCSNISLISHLPLSELSGKVQSHSANDIWGHVDLNTGKEYALIGLQLGTAVVDVSNASEPKVIKVIDGPSTTWRDIKVYQFYDQQNQHWRAYAYVTSDNVNEGVAIIDLSQLQQNLVRLVQKQDVHNNAHNIYISGVDYQLNIANATQLPLVHVAGSNNTRGALQSYSLSDPEQLTLTYSMNNATSADYTHDAASLTIDDSRSQQCPLAVNNQCLIILDFNELEFNLWDQTSGHNKSLLSTTTYDNAEYVHSGWWSENKQYVFVHDELDEQRNNLNSTLRIFDITDLSSPQLAGTWQGSTRAIDHNGFVRGNRYYMSNYERGLTILDISDPESPTEMGFFDTYPVADNPNFNGAWGVYPFLPSGLILVSDINSGLYILRDDTLTTHHNYLSFATTTQTTDEGDVLQLQVTRQGDTSQATSVQYQTLPGSADSNDFEELSGTLQWPTGDNSARTITVNILADTLDDEVTEHFFVRLFNPQSNVQLGQNNLNKIAITGKANTGSISLAESEITLRENQSTVSLEVFRSGGDESNISVSYELQSQSAEVGSDIENATGELSWADGDSAAKQITLTLVNDEQTEPDETLLLILSSDTEDLLGNTRQMLITIRDDESNLPPTAEAGSDRQVNTRQTVSITGSGEDPEGDELSFEWQQTGGAAVSMDGADTATISFVAPATSANLTFTLTVTDSFGISHSDDIAVKVIAPVSNDQGNNSSGGGGSLSFLLMLLLLLNLRKRNCFHKY